ncbi:hypothetical protein ACFYYM_34420 [Streptomyces erythrochromogenes]|uniref:hypothetical protein n=1 Tax=Streptomyces erythrochromogenes TaxID=285574 RepID=UPI00367F55E2
MVITGRAVSQGYGLEDLEEDLPAVTAEWRAQSNWSAVDHKALAAGEDFDSAEFIEGMREWGFAVTLPAHLAVPGEGLEEPLQQDGVAAYAFRLEFENFHVHRQVGDGWPSTGDEIRWVSGGQSDLRAPARPFLSQEFGGRSAEAGQTTAFTPAASMRMVFEGPADRGLVLNVACWEWDTGDGNDDSITENLIKLNDDPLFGLIWTAVGQLAPTLIGLLMDLTSLGITIVSVIAKNDLSSSRTFYLDRHALAALSQGRQREDCGRLWLPQRVLPEAPLAAAGRRSARHGRRDVEISLVFNTSWATWTLFDPQALDSAFKRKPRREIPAGLHNLTNTYRRHSHEV